MHIKLGAIEFSVPAAFAQTLMSGMRNLPKGTTAFREGSSFDYVVLVMDGWLSTTKSFESGDTQLIDFGLPGDLLVPATADGVTAGLTATALTDVEICMIPTAVWHDMLHEIPALRTTHEHMEAAERARLSERILRLGKGNAKTRIAYALLELCVRLDALETCEVTSFHIPLTQAKIGDFTCLSTVHVCRMMGEFVQAGLIQTEDHLDIHITDLKHLSELAGIQADHLAFEIKPELT